MRDELELRSAPPLDFSYARLRRLSQLVGLEPRIDRVRRVPQIGDNGKYITRSLWLSNNLLRSLNGLRATVERLLWRPETLAWIDLSYNALVEVGCDLSDFQELVIVHLHGNRVHTISGVAALRQLPRLAHLTLHSNPLANVPYYRGRVLSLLPGLRTLDGDCVLPLERAEPLPVFAPTVTVVEQPAPPPQKTAEEKLAATASWLELVRVHMSMRLEQIREAKRLLEEAENSSSEEELPA